ncbi:acyltransferase [Pseudomonas mediterranea]|uniref:acyltransferase n=1 Tax=Pseudomonas mediterranea TaxID=183795 RepID=UPI0009EADA9C|nr:acyltransferase [Pseudomonas mediterranea]MDU9029258.1 acyltransferase [Pseudomonas mediterranea]
MAYLSKSELEALGFKRLGRSVKVSSKACIYNAEDIEIDDYSRIDDFCIISGNVKIGKYNHITPMCLVAGGSPGIEMEDFCTLAYGVKVFAQSDDYTGETLTNSLIPKHFKNEKFASVKLKKHVIVGANSTIFPGVTVEEGCSIGAMTLVTKNTESWGIYFGVPARRIRDRRKDLLQLEQEFLFGAAQAEK